MSETPSNSPGLPPGWYAPSTREFSAAVCDAVKEMWRGPDPKPLPPEDRPVAERLAQFNRRGGASEEQAFAAAEGTPPR